MGIIGPEYEFLAADIGMNGRMSDGGNWSRNEFRMNLADVNNPLGIPAPKCLPGRKKPVPHVLVGDDAFPLTSYMMKPYPQTGLNEEKRIFNYRLSRCRHISENAFGILGNRWRVFRSRITLAPDKVSILVLGAITLHNYLRSNSTTGKIYMPEDILDREDPVAGKLTPGTWHHDETHSFWQDLPPCTTHNATFEAKEIRKEFNEYFMMEGALPWQWKSANIAN